MTTSEHDLLEARRDKRHALNLGVSPAYRQWLHARAEAADTTVSRIIRRAIRQLAAAEGWTPPPAL
jgi:hypothetical protein